MKLAIVIPGFQSDERDWCIPAFTNLARSLSQRMELHIFALRYPPRRDDYTLGSTLVHSIGAGAIGGRRYFGLSLLNTWFTFQKEFEREHSVGPFDAVVGIWATESGWLATQVAQRHGLPSLVHLAGGELVNLPAVRYGNWGRLLEGGFVRTSLRRADVVTSPSAPLTRRLKRIKMDMRKVRRWAPGVNTEMFTPGEDPGAPRPFTFITVASLVPVKGHRLLFRAFNNLRRKAPDLPIRWLIVGDGPLRAELEAAAAVPRLRGYVDILGEVTHDRLPELYREAGAFLLGSLHEAQCMAVLEAMACGLPWVGPKVGAIDDLVRIDEGETPSGLAFAVRKHDLVADLMLRMAQEAPDLRRSWGEQARRRVVREYEVERQTERLVGLLGELTG